MPGFVRTKKDEATWKKAKEKAAESKGKEESSFSDTDWALVNHIYHKMTKSVHEKLKDKSSVEFYIEELLKIRRHLTGMDRDLEDAPSYSDDEDSDIPQGFSLDEDPENYSSDEEQDDEAAKWLRAKEQGESDMPEGSTEEGLDPQDDEWQSQRSAADQPAKRSRFEEMTPERLSVLRPLAGHWLDHYDKIRMRDASAKNNPLLYAEGHRQAASEMAHRDHENELKRFQNSDEFKALPKMAQLKAIVDFKKKFLASNPNFHQKALDAINDTQQIKDNAVNLANKEKQMKEAEIIHGGAAMMPPTGMSAEEAAQHVGGEKDEEGYSANITSDPRTTFAAGNKNFLNLVAGDKEARGSRVISPQEISDVEDMPAHNAFIDQHPVLKKPENRKHINDFFSEYMPLININASKVIKNKTAAGLPEDKMDKDDLNIAGMHGLMQAALTYDPDVGASFPTHASRKIAGAMNSKISGQDFLTRQLRSQINYYNKHGKLPEPEFKQKARADQFAHRKQQPAEQESTSVTALPPTSQPSQAPAPAAPSAPPPQPKKTAHETIQSSNHPDAANMIERKNVY